MNFWDWFWFIVLTMFIGLPIVGACMMNAKPENEGKVGLTVLAVWCGLYGWIWLSNKAEEYEWGKEVEKPEIGFEMYGYLLAGTDLSWVRERGGNFEAQVADQVQPRFENSSFGKSDSSPNIRFEIKNDNACLKKADCSIVIMQNGKVIEDPKDYLFGGSSILGTYRLDYGASVLEIVAKNTAGETRKTLFVTKYHMREACAKFDLNNTVSRCQEYTEYDAEKKRDEENWAKIQEENRQNAANKPAAPADDCLHRDEGICWDEIDEAGYEDGMYDGMRGTYNQLYFDSLPERFGDCEGLCEDIYMDAYDEGYADGQAELKRRR